MALTLNRRQLLQGTGVAVAAAAMSPLMQSAAFAATPGITAYGGSVCYGLGLGKNPPPDKTWFAQTALALGLDPGLQEDIPTPTAINGAIPGTVLRSCIDEQAKHPERDRWGQFFWGGHADVNKGLGPKVLRNIGILVNKYPLAPYLILGITNGETGGIGTDYYTEALAPGGINDQLATKYKDKFFNVQTFLTDLSSTGAMAVANLPITDVDRQCVQEGRVPKSLRAAQADVHLNLSGQTAVAKQTTPRARTLFGF